MVDELARARGFGAYKEKFSGLWSKGSVQGEDVVLLKPQTFMNLSGDSVQPAQTFFKVPPERIVAVHDELDIPFGEVRLKVGGGHAGHNGLRSMIARLGTADFLRLRVGVGRPPADFRGKVADFLLTDFGALDAAHWPDVVGRAVQALELLIAEGVVRATNRLHAKP